MVDEEVEQTGGCTEILNSVRCFCSAWLRMASQGVPLIPETQHEHTDHNQRQREDLSHRQRSEDEPKVRIRLTKQLHHQPAKPIARNKTPKDRSWRRGFSSDQPEDRKQEQPFEASFVEL